MSVFETVDVAVKRPRLFSVDYTITYAPRSNVKSTNFHVVKVTAASGLTASTRSGYYTDDSRSLE